MVTVETARPLDPLVPERAYSDERYLLAKRTVDDRAINRVLVDWLRRELARFDRRPEILELGAGVGTMVERLVSWGVLREARYTLLDRDRGALQFAERALRRFNAVPGGDPSHREPLMVFRFVAADVSDFLGETRLSFDLVIANAFLDLVDAEHVLPEIWRVLRPGCPFWFPINFDGETVFLPAHQLDELVLSLYHRSMDHRPGGRGHSRTGRRLLLQIPASHARVDGVGSSDWVVWPTRPDGTGTDSVPAYPEDEAYFLHHLIHTIALELEQHPLLDQLEFRNWQQLRHAQVEQGELHLIAHQLDFAGYAPGVRA